VLPLAEFEKRMRAGKLAFKWGQLQGWCSAQVSGSAPAGMDIELPLATLVPLFMAARKAPNTRKKIEVDTRIPDVFGKSQIPEAAAAPEPASEPAPAPAADPVAPAPAPVAVAAPALRLEPASEPAPPAAAPVAPEAPVAPAAPAPAPAFRLEQPSTPPPSLPEASPAQPAPAATGPAQIGHHVRTLNGVGGAFLATSDGLLIAAEVPDANENVLAAFAPTVFSQLAKYSDMARLGQPQSIDIHLTGASIHVRKAGKHYLGVLTAPGNPLPFEELERISTALQPHAP
jgi:predicted regulator of Ras-like GTPase activity (Roadblock/LC7/MglB family)